MRKRIIKAALCLFIVTGLSILLYSCNEKEHEHRMGDRIWIVEPACDIEGTYEETCLDCGYVSRGSYKLSYHKMRGSFCEVCGIGSEEYFEYELLDNDTYKIVRLKNPESQLHTPLRYNGKNVTTIAKGALKNDSTVTHVYFSDSITTVEEEAFYGSTSLISVKFTKSIELIGHNAFANCSSLVGIVIPDTNVKIEMNAFRNCKYYNVWTLWEEGMFYIDNHLIEVNGGRKEYHLKEGTVTIASNAFKFGTDVYLPESVSYISPNAFAAGASIYITDISAWMSMGYDKSEEHPYEGCASITLLDESGNQVNDIVIPDGTTEICDYAFRQVNGMKSISIPASVEYIGKYAFGYGLSKVEVYIRDFKDVASWLNIRMHEKGRFLTSSSETHFIDSNGNEITEIIIPDGITTIPDSKFSGCGSVKKIYLPDSVSEIGDYAFYDIYSDDLSMPFTIEKIGQNAFTSAHAVYIRNVDLSSSIQGLQDIIVSCDKSLSNIHLLDKDGEEITEVIITDGTEEIGYLTFQCCVGLKKITIPSSVKSIGANAFLGCTALEDVYYTNLADVNEYLNIEFANTDSYPNKYGYLHLIDKSGNEIKEIVITESDASIPDYYFKKIILDKLVLGDNVSVGYSSFGGAKVKSAELPVSVIGKLAYADIESLLVVSGEKISSSQFDGYSMLETLTLSDKIISIGKGAVDECENLKKINIMITDDFSNWLNKCEFIVSDLIPYVPGVDNSNKIAFYFVDSEGNEITDVVIPDSVSEIRARAFAGFKNIKSITIPSTVTRINLFALRCGSLENLYFKGYEDGADWLKIEYDPNDENPRQCGKTHIYDKYGFEIREITIPDSFTNIPEYAFVNCVNLKNVYIHSDVKHIGGYAFYGCESLETVDIPDTQYSIGGYTFYGCSSLKEITLPDNLQKIYNYAFYGCRSLEEISIPFAVNYICGDAFLGCNNLRKAYFISVSNWRSTTYHGVIESAYFEDPVSAVLMLKGFYDGDIYRT